MRLILSNFTDLNVVYKEKTFKVKVIGILGDNEFLQMLHKHKRNWLARGMNNCRTCTVDDLPSAGQSGLQSIFFYKRI
uniref:Uncharacterized protein n=1 Tax=Strongyloides venezuelensis TaxID=75913 RepID=A0A0K0G5Z9_STRVS